MPTATDKIKILNVDDNEISLYTKSRILRRAGFEVKEAANGLEALQLVATERPHLALLDVNLPDITGFEVCRRIKADPALASTLVLQISASAIQGKDKALGLGLGADNYLTEPVEPEELVASVKALLRLKQAEEKLRQQEERLRIAFDVANMGAWDWDIPTGQMTWSGHYERLFGLVPGTFEGSYEAFLKLVHPEDRDRVNETITHSLTTGAEYAAQFRVLWPNGTLHWLASKGQILTDPAGRPSRLIGVMQDITQSKQAEEVLVHSAATLQTINQTLGQQLSEQTVELERSLKDLDQFVYVASHDLRAPLRAIDHLATWINEDAGEQLPDPSKLHLAQMKGRIKRMEKFFEDLLTYSRIERHYAKRVEKVDPVALVREIITLLEPPPGFTLTVQEDIPTLITYRALLELVLRNLIDNAIKHHDRPDGHVQISARELGDFIEFSVTDDGPGIGAAFHERVFQLFQILKPRDQVEGSGIGLAIAKKVVEGQGGIITLTSAEGEGATLRFTWPKR